MNALIVDAIRAQQQLEDFIATANGDLDLAASDLWQRYRDAHPEAVDG